MTEAERSGGTFEWAAELADAIASVQQGEISTMRPAPSRAKPVWVPDPAAKTSRQLNLDGPASGDVNEDLLVGTQPQVGGVARDLSTVDCDCDRAVGLDAT